MQGKSGLSNSIRWVYKPENMKNFRKGMEVHYTYNNSGRPTGGGNPTTVVENVKFATGEEPEFEVIPDA